MNESIRKFFEELDLIMSEGDTKAALTHLMDSAELIRYAALPQQKQIVNIAYENHEVNITKDNEFPIGNIQSGYKCDNCNTSLTVNEINFGTHKCPPYKPRDYAHNQPDCGKMSK